MSANRDDSSVNRRDVPVRSDRSDTAAYSVAGGVSTRDEVLEREKARYGGMKFGSAFFGWLTATGTAVILTAVLAATGTAVGLGSEVNPTRRQKPCQRTRAPSESSVQSCWL